mgnify:CR=1 FL=1
MKKITFVSYLILLLPSPVFGEVVEIYTVAQLDDYRGYCLDIKGYKLKARINKGMQVHTCYSYQDEIAVDQGFDSFKLTQNQFFMPAFSVCIEAGSATPSAPIRLAKCQPSKLQEFKWDEKGRIFIMSNIKLCLTVDNGESRKGGGGVPVHLKRDLTLEICSDRLTDYQVWGIRKID